MRVRTLTLAATGVALLAPTAYPAAASLPYPKRVVFHEEGGPSAAQLRRAVRGCDQISRGRYRQDAGTPARVRICGTRGSVHWKADLDIDCDGRPTAHCNRRTDPTFAATTAFQQSDGRMLNAEKLPYIVVPPAGPRWSHRAHGIRGGSVAAVLYRDRLTYAVVGDTGPRDIIGEASYATARALGIDPNPRYGGAPSGVTYIVFEHARVRPIEDHEAAVTLGERLARRLVRHAG
ncbi:glycoside hydrolase family 75 protein [Streptomyces sp. NPDC059575]|uniref:glycoside hydrolase family 75 protein n=1 Tax=Streptomyces sp. NPDC059575 TaxID=3346872 RepID=UPI003683FE72